MDEGFAWAEHQNLNLIVQFHNEVRRLMHNEIVSLNQKIKTTSDENCKRELDYAKGFYPTTYSRMLRDNTVLDDVFVS